MKTLTIPAQHRPFRLEEDSALLVSTDLVILRFEQLLERLYLPLEAEGGERTSA